MRNSGNKGQPPEEKYDPEDPPSLPRTTSDQKSNNHNNSAYLLAIKAAQEPNSNDSSDTSSSFHAIRFMLFNTINYKLEFSDEKLNEQYFIFRTASTSPFFALGVAIFLLFVYVVFWSFVFRVWVHPYSLTIAAVGFVFSILLFWILIYFRFTIPLADQQMKCKTLLVTLATCVSVGTTVALGLVLLMRSLRRCPSADFSDRWSCTTGYGTGAIPSDVTVVLLFAPLIFSIIFPFLSFSTVYLCQFIAIGFVLGLLIALRGSGSSVHASLVIGLSLFILIVYRLQQMELFLYTTKYYQALKEQTKQDKMLATRLSNEMKNLISSISHDLKSVSLIVFTLKPNFMLKPFHFHNILASFCVYSRL
jgi:hypothetical protein